MSGVFGCVPVLGKDQCICAVHFLIVPSYLYSLCDCLPFWNAYFLFQIRGRKGSLFILKFAFITTDCFHVASIPFRPPPASAFITRLWLLEYTWRQLNRLNVALASLNLACHYATSNAGQIGRETLVSSYKCVSLLFAFQSQIFNL